ncbi:MAG: Bax inhibitor-1 family protein [Thermoguttaceae bacterium]|jgi:FtsH-binding integral membrane protein|nr:Bax inhibitor-1 family protein [Thermoguttaceae bacterium]
MNNPNNVYDARDFGARAAVVSQSRLVTKTYANLTGAVLAFAALESLIFALVGVNTLAVFIQQNVTLVSLILLGLCLGGPALGNMIIGSEPSRPAQYGLLAFYVVLYAAIFLPILTFAQVLTGDTRLIWQAIGLTASLFIALSASVFMTRKNFSFLRTALVFGSIAALITIVAAFIFQFALGLLFSSLLIALACGYILYETSTLIHEAGEGDDVLMSVMLFSSVMMLFFYILRILAILNSRN